MHLQSCKLPVASGDHQPTVHVLPHLLLDGTASTWTNNRATATSHTQHSARALAHQPTIHADIHRSPHSSRHPDCCGAVQYTTVGEASIWQIHLEDSNGALQCWRGHLASVSGCGPSTVGPVPCMQRELWHIPVVTGPREQIITTSGLHSWLVKQRRLAVTRSRLRSR